MRSPLTCLLHLEAEHMGTDRTPSANTAFCWSVCVLQVNNGGHVAEL